MPPPEVVRTTLPGAIDSEDCRMKAVFNVAATASLPTSVVPAPLTSPTEAAPSTTNLAGPRVVTMPLMAIESVVRSKPFSTLIDAL